MIALVPGIIIVTECPWSKISTQQFNIKLRPQVSSLVRLSASLEEFEVVEMPLVALRRSYPAIVHVVQSTVQQLDPTMRRVTLVMLYNTC